MIENEENEVLNLPKTVMNEPTSTNGALKRYQEKLVERFYTVFCSFQKLVKEVSESCEQQLQQRMVKFQDDSNQISKKKEEIMSTLGKTSYTFDELRDQLKSLGQNLVELSCQLREDSLAIYTGSFSKLKPIVDRAYESCELYLSQLPPQYSEKLPLEVKRLNENFLQTKSKLIRALYSIEISSRKKIEATDCEFIQRADEWKQNRFITLVEEAKKQLDYNNNKLDFSEIFSNFRKDQIKFTFCFKKLVSNIALFAPPEHFTSPDLESWWSEVIEMTESHKNFISKFIGQFQSKIDQRNQENTQLISTLEKELFEYVTESDANQAMCELYPLYKQTQKYYALLIEKLQRYWNGRIESLYKSFESISNFLKPLIEDYQNFISEADENNDFVINETNEIRNNSQSEINQLESDLQMKLNEIFVLSAEEDINNCVKQCKEILANIGDKYNESYSKIISTYDTQPSLLTSLFDKIEKNILDIMKLKKVSCEDDSSPNSALNEAEKRKKGSASGQRNTRKTLKNKGDLKNAAIHSFVFHLPNGTKYEEVSLLELVPQFDDFIDEPQNVELTPQKGKGGKNASAQAGTGGNERKATPNKGKRNNSTGKTLGKGNVSNKKTNNKNGGYSADDFEDVECPDFCLSDVVPKEENGTVSIWVYIPMNEEIFEWTNNFRKLLLTSINNQYETKMKRALYRNEREELRDELTEKMRVHAPRASSIEMNVAQKRKNEIGSRQAQLEKHFLRAVSNFNNGVENILSSVDRRTKLMENECNKLRSFIDNLSNMKNATNFAVLVQNLKVSEKQWENYFEKQKNEQKKEMDNFINNFNAVNQRFMDTVVMSDSTFSEEEKEHCKEYFSNMKTHVDSIIKELESKVSSSIGDVDKLHNSIIEEFESNLNVHKTDVTFIESLKLTQMNSKNKFEALLAKNKMMENEVDRLIGLVKVNDNVDLQSRLTDLFQKLDTLRISISKRGYLLSLIKTQPNQTPINLSLDLLQQQQMQQKGNEENSTISNKKSGSDSKKGARSGANNGANDDDKKHLKGKGKNKSKSASDKSNVNDKNNSNDSNDPSSSSNSQNNNNESQKLIPLKSQFDKIESDFNATVLKLATEYYNNLKTRKMQITRPDQIPEQQQDCIDKYNEIWKNTTKSFQEVISKSTTVFQTQVQNAGNISREMQKILYQVFSSFYIEQILKDKSDVQNQFDQRMAELMKEKEKHKTMMNANSADSNQINEFKKLIDEENDRVLKETDAITVFNIQNIECEYRNMTLFTTNLPIFTAKLLNLFDRFIQIDDMSTNSNVSKGIERKTMRELMKEKTRKSATSLSNDPNGRPFHIRDWPTLPSIMEPIINSNQRAQQSALQSVEILKNIGVRPSSSSALNTFASGATTALKLGNNQIDPQNLNSSSNINTTSNSNLIAKKKKATLKGSGTTNASTSGMKLQPIDDNNQKQMMAVVKGLDTALNRGVIIERNKCYEDYEKALSKRIDEFEKYIQSLKEETESFMKYWQTCIADLNPEFYIQNQENNE